MAKMKLFRVSRIETTVVVALDPVDAENVSRECDWGEPAQDLEVEEVKTMSKLKLIPEGDWAGAIPIGRQEDNPDELTCTDILEGRLESKEKKHAVSVRFWADAVSHEKRRDEIRTAVENVVKKMGYRLADDAELGEM